MRWELAHPNHAIERVSVSFHFSEGIPTKPWQSILNSAALELPKKGFNDSSDDVEINLAQIVAPNIRAQNPELAAAGPANIPGQSIQSRVAGRTFRVLSGSDVLEEVTLHRQRLLYASTRYDGWARFKDRLLAVVNPFLGAALPIVNLNVLKLEYWDRFVFDGSLEDVDYRDLLRPTSRHLPSFPFDTRELWHSHVGYFTPAAETNRILVNVNVDVLDLKEAEAAPTASQRRSVGIYSMAQETLGQAVSPSDAAGALPNLDFMHHILKQALADVITDEAAERIALNLGNLP